MVFSIHDELQAQRIADGLKQVLSAMKSHQDLPKVGVVSDFSRSSALKVLVIISVDTPAICTPGTVPACFSVVVG